MAQRIISHYEILEKLAEGGMGTVYKARDLNLPRLAVLKFLNPRLVASQVARQRFVREANAIASLNHVNIATIYEFETKTEEPFLVLEFLPGGTLAQRILTAGAGRGLPFSQVLEYAGQMSEALSYAHQKGIVHRDVKPGNALFAEDGRLKITDFGLSKLCGSSDLSEPGVVMGTPRYMSPEQARGAEVDARSDIFSLGCVLYEMAAGAPPFRGANVINEVLNLAPPELRERRPELSEGFAQVVARTLEKDRQSRYQSVTELLDDLRALRRGAVVSVRGKDQADIETLSLGRPETPARRKRWSTRRALLMAAVLMVALLAFLYLRWPPPVPAERRVAVLPFRNINKDAAGQAICDGLAEILTSKLTQLEKFQGRLWVVPASEVREQSVTSALQARRAFRVNLAITGSLQRLGPQMRLTASLLDAENQRQLRSFDETVGDLSVLQDAFAARVASMLDLELQPGARQLLAEGRTAAPGAYDYYVQGHGYLRRYGPPQDDDNAIRLFRLALELDPKYALACAGLGEAYWHKYVVTKDAQWIQQARAWCRRALELNDRLAPVHVALGLIQNGTGNQAEAIREYQRALELSPDNADAYSELANVYAEAGKLSDAEATYKRAIQLQPGYWGFYSDLGRFYDTYGRYADAQSAFEHVVQLTPDNPKGYGDLGGLLVRMAQYDKALEVLWKSPEKTGEIYSNIGTALFFQRRYREAVDAFEKAAQLNPKSYMVLGNLADGYRWAPGSSAKAPETYRRAIEAANRGLAVNPNDVGTLVSVAVYEAKLGEKGLALPTMDKALRLAPGNTIVAFQSVLVYELTGDRDRALKVLETALRAGYSLGEASREPELNHLREDRRYRQMLERLHLKSEAVGTQQ